MVPIRSGLVAAVLAIGCFGACKGKDAPPGDPAAADKAVDKGGGKLGDPKPADGPLVSTPKPKLTGRVVNPTVTSSITFVVPKDQTTWGELAFPCYRAAMELQAGNKASQAFYQVSPLIEPALKAADIDIDTDFEAIGGWQCGGAPCIYIAATLRHPEKLGAMLQAIPGITPKQTAPGEWSFDAPGAQGMRSIHLSAVPIQWPDALPGDAWSTDMAKATHVLFLTGLMGKTDTTDPLSTLADAKTALDRVRDTEGVLSDPHGRCVLGTVGANDFKPGFKLDHARFAFGAPPGHGDSITSLLGSNRTLDVELELTLSPAAKESDVTTWIADSRAWVASTMAPVRAQFASQGPLVDGYMELLGIVGESGFGHELNGKALSLSWRTNRVPQSQLSAIETKFAGLLPPQ